MRLVRVNLRKWSRQILGLSDTPRSIALATALGMFIAFSPTYGFQVILALTAAMLLRCNKIATVLPVFLTNPVTAPPLVFLQYLLGRMILGGGSQGNMDRAKDLAEALGNVSIADLRHTLGHAAGAVQKLGWGVLGPTLLGGMLSSALVGLLTYPLVYRGVIWFRRRRAERMELRRRKAAEAPAPADRPPAEKGAAEAPSGEPGPVRPAPDSPGPQEAVSASHQEVPPPASVGTGVSGKP